MPGAGNHVRFFSPCHRARPAFMGRGGGGGARTGRNVARVPYAYTLFFAREPEIDLDSRARMEFSPRGWNGFFFIFHFRRLICWGLGARNILRFRNWIGRNARGEGQCLIDSRRAFWTFRWWVNCACFFFQRMWVRWEIVGCFFRKYLSFEFVFCILEFHGSYWKCDFTKRYLFVYSMIIWFIPGHQNHWNSYISHVFLGLTGSNWASGEMLCLLGVLRQLGEFEWNYTASFCNIPYIIVILITYICCMI